MGDEVQVRIRQALWTFDPYGIGDEIEEVPEEYDDLLDEVVEVLMRANDRRGLRAWVQLLASRFDLGASDAVVRDLDILESSIWQAWGDRE